MMMVMEGKSFSIGEALRFGWGAALSNFWFFVGVLAVVVLVTTILSVLSEFFIADVPFISFFFALVSWVVGIIVSLGLLGIMLAFADGQKPPLAKLFSYAHLFFNYLFASAIYGLIVIAGLLLLIVPGIIWAIKFQFYPFAIIDKGLGSLAALKESSRITQGVKMKLFLFGLVITGVNFLGALVLGLGLLVTIPTTMVATAFVYRRLAFS